MAADRRKQALLGVLLVVLAVVAYRAFLTAPPPAAGATQAASNVRAGRPAQGSADKGDVPDVRLESLDSDRPSPGDSDRNVFEFKQPPASPPVAQPPRTATVPPPAVPSGPPPGPAVPPIALKFIGVIEAPDARGKIAILSDARGVYHGREGEIVEGQYRILKIGTESIEIAHIDGRGRQTIRLSGS